MVNSTETKVIITASPKPRPLRARDEGEERLHTSEDDNREADVNLQLRKPRTVSPRKFISVVIVTVIIFGGGVWFLSTQGAKEQVKLSKPLIGEAIASQGANHVSESTKEEYNTNPPTSGPHYANSQPAGIYDKPVPDGNLIHSMEHGAVILWYKPTNNTENQVAEGTESAKIVGLSQQDIDRLKQIFSSVQVSKKIMVPRDSLDVPVALTSWERLLKLQTIDESQIKNFMETNEDRGPEKAPL